MSSGVVSEIDGEAEIANHSRVSQWLTVPAYDPRQAIQVLGIPNMFEGLT